MSLFKKLLDHFEREIQLNKEYYAGLNKTECEEPGQEEGPVDIMVEQRPDQGLDDPSLDDSSLDDMDTNLNKLLSNPEYEFLDSAIRSVLEAEQVSVSMLQRKLKLRYGQAARLIDQMEELGVVGPFAFSTSRTILISMTQYMENREKILSRIESPYGLDDSPEDTKTETDEFLQISTQSFPYSMDDMMNLDIDILLKQPTMLILSWGIEECEKMISRILDHCCSDFEKTPICLLANSVTDVFVMHRYHPCNPLSAYGLEKVASIINWAYMETNKRINLASTIKKKAYAGVPIYLFLDNFSIIRQRPQDPIAAKLAHIMLCARQANVHTIVFDRPDSFQTSEFSWFSSIVMLSNSYRDKYKRVVPSQFREIKTGTFCIFTHCGEIEIHEI